MCSAMSSLDGEMNFKSTDNFSRQNVFSDENRVDGHFLLILTAKDMVYELGFVKLQAHKIRALLH